MEKGKDRKDIRNTVDTENQVNQIFEALDKPATEPNGNEMFPQDFSASGSGKGNTGNIASIEN